MIQTRKYITYYMPGSFMPETSTKEVQSFEIPGSLPNDCYGFEFHETDFAEVNGKEFTGETRRQPAFYLIGWIVPLTGIPNTHEYYILRRNIEINSPSQEGIRTRMGNWQFMDEGRVVLPPDRFQYTDALIYKNAKAITTPLQ